MLWAVHISSGVLTWPWIVGGLVIAALLLVAGCWRLQPEEVPRIALLTAVFYIGSSIHIPVATLWAHFQGGDVDAGLAELEAPAKTMIDDLLWWTAALKTARANAT